LPEVEFLTPIAERLIDKGYNIGFVVFHEAAVEMLEKKNVPFFNMHQLGRSGSYGRLSDADLEKFTKIFGIENIRYLYVREMLAYNRRNESALCEKIIHYMQILDKIFAENQVKCVVQELGDFGANQAVYYAARKNQIDHVFYEPSAFSGRIVFNTNNYYSDIPDKILADSDASPEILNQVNGYLERYLKQKPLVVPLKDKHSFADQTLGKIINIENLKKLKRKLVHKYVLRQKEEYDEITWVMKYNFVKLIRRMFLSFYYTRNMGSSDKYIYYPFHVPHDVQLTSRSKLFYFQEGFVEYLSRSIPYGYKLYVKEHPASIGGQSFWMLRSILKQHRNVRLLHPRHNSFDLIENASLTVTVNSKVGFEALMQGRKVVVVGDVFYKNKDVTYDVNNIKDLEKTIRTALEASPPSKERIMDFLVKAYRWSYPCELFYMEKENLERSYESFYTHLTTEVLGKS
jgi:hypothetical protein